VNNITENVVASGCIYGIRGVGSTRGVEQHQSVDSIRGINGQHQGVDSTRGTDIRGVGRHQGGCKAAPSYGTQHHRGCETTPEV
jgi:hypothetical protein